MNMICKKCSQFNDCVFIDNGMQHRCSVISAYKKGYEDAKANGWHPASEPPKEDGEYIVISLPNIYGSTDVFYAEYRQPYGWCYEIEGHYAKINIQKWCYPPKED